MSLPDPAPAQRFTSAAFWSTSAAAVSQIVRFGLFVALSRLVSPTEFGVVALAAILVELLSSVSDGGMFDAAIQRRSLDDREASTAFWLMTGIGVLLFGVALLLSPLAAWVFRTPAVGPVVALMSLSLAVAPLGAVHLVRETRRLAFRRLAMWSLASSIVGGLVGIALALAGHGVLALAVRGLVTAAVMVVLAWIGAPWRPRLAFDRAAASDLLRFGGSLLGSRIVAQVNARGVELIAGLTIAPAAVGFLRVGGQCLNLLTQLTVAPLTQIAMPLLARARDDDAAYRDALVRVAGLSALVLYPAFFGAMAVSSVALPLVFGAHWAVAGSIMPILCVMAPALHANLLISAVLVAKGRGRLMFYWSLAQAVVGLPLAAIGGVFGLYPLVILSVVKSYLLIPVGLVWIRRAADTEIAPLWRGAWRPLLMAVAMAAAVEGLKRALPASLAPPEALALLVGAGMALFVAGMLVIDPELRRQVGEGLRRVRARAAT
ncbi:lipopolysaccharide biosynthesis protein [Brevundimonas sp.]|uniref:lipopolysaccharide biosynthesis protein n=1 Tax=Brevundimonas sp. TaxID=1871086 RepID=UPI0035B485B6